MCGIAGFYSPEHTLDRALLKNMAGSLQHRGPDAEGVFLTGAFGLAHRRLSIIDPETRSDQPMTSRSGRFTIVFNGELYNYRELSQKYHLSVSTHSDTEVLLEAFELKGIDIFTELNGMFAGVLFDRQEEKLFLFRDRMGKKPLYYYDQEDFIFASELKTFFCCNKKLSKNKTALGLFLHLGFIPQPFTAFNEIKKLPQGTCLVKSGQETQLVSWWKLQEQLVPEVLSDESEALNTLEKLLQESVRYRMISDVPFGAFLSGGIDSSLVAAMASRYSEKPLKTFTVGFEEENYNEAIFARQIAQRLNTEHHEIFVKQTDALDQLLRITDQFDEPFADTSALPVHLISAFAAQSVKMVLSGDGGDELFMGYGAYTWARRLNNPLIRMAGSAFPHLDPVLPDRIRRTKWMFGKTKSRQSQIFSQEQYLFSRQELIRLVSQNFQPAELLPHPKGKRILSPIEEQAFFDLSFYLPDDLLVKTDRASMANSLEVRCPLLDHRIISFALNLSTDLKIRNGDQKYLLKKLLFNYIPAKLFQRPKKGFSIPLKEWLSQELHFLIEQYLSRTAVEQTGFLNYREIEKLKKEFESGRKYLYNRLWALILLQRWLLKYGND